MGLEVQESKNYGGSGATVTLTAQTISLLFVLFLNLNLARPSAEPTGSTLILNVAAAGIEILSVIV